MSETPQSTPDDPPESPEAESQSAPIPWYRRPATIIGLIVLILLLAVILPPVVASEVPVGLSDEGQTNAQNGGWQEQEENDSTTAVAGLVLVDPVTLVRNNEAGIRDGVFVYTTVKIPVMLPQGLVSNQLEENALEQLQSQGVNVDIESHHQEPYTQNGHEGTISYYSGTADDDGFFLDDTAVELFIATWRCSILGSFAVVVGAAGDTDEIDDGGGILGSGNPSTTNISTQLRQIENDLLAHTHCEA